MRPTLTVLLLPILLIGSAMGGEPERKSKVQALIKQLADESPKDRQAAYSELRDNFVRKRDIPELTKEIARNANPEIKKSLGELIPFLEGRRWRLPDEGWTTDVDECYKCYKRAFDDLGSGLALVDKESALDSEMGKSYQERRLLLHLHPDTLEIPIENRTGMANLILTLEPEALFLWEYWDDLAFVATLSNLEKLDLSLTKVTDLTPLKGLQNLSVLSLCDTKVTDLTPLKGLPKLRYLGLQDTGVTDLTPLNGLPELWGLWLENTGVTDLTPLKGLPKLVNLELQNTGVTDLTPLNGLPELRSLNLQNTGVTDLTPLKSLPELSRIYLKNTGVTDVSPLRGLPELDYLDLRNTKVTDVTPLKEIQGLQIREGTE